MAGVTEVGRRRSWVRDFCVAICAVMGVVLVWSRLANLGTSLWSDEAYSAFYYSGRGPHAIFFDAYVPNNHVLYNLLSWATTGAVGRFEGAYRIWSVVPGIAAVVLAAWWANRRIGPIAATSVVVLAVVSPVHLVLTPQARGYGLAMFAGVLMLVGAIRATDQGATRDVVVFAIGALVGVLTLPVFALAAIAQAGVLLWNKELRKRTLIACGVIAVVALAVYAPMLGGILDNSHQQFGARLTISAIATGAYHQLAAPTIGNALPASPHSLFNQVATFLVIMALTIAAVARLLRKQDDGLVRKQDDHLLRKHDRALLANLVVPIFFTYLALVIGRFYVQPRFASYLLFHVLLLFAIGAQQLWDLCSRFKPALIVAAIAIVALSITGTSRVASLTAEQARLPWENNQFVANLAKSTGQNYVFTDSTHPVALYYYLGADHVKLLQPAAVRKQAYCAVKSRFIFVDDTYHQKKKPSFKCLIDRRAVRIRVPQQKIPPIRRPGVLTVYLVPATRK